MKLRARYVRYVGPDGSHCNVAELMFYGTEGEGDDSHLYQMTNLPLVVIRTVDDAEVTSRETFLDGWISIISDGGTTFFTDTLKIRGRGNGSWDVSKDRGVDEKFKCCTVWDFDLAFENDLRTYPINNLTDYLCLCPNSSAAGDMKNFVRNISDTQQERICELWSEARDNRGFTPENILAYVDSLAQELDLSQTYNFLRWPILNVYVQKNFQILGSYTAEVEFMKQYIADRFVWMDEKTGYNAMSNGIADMRATLSGRVYTDGQGICLVGFPKNCTYRIVTVNGQFVAQGQTAATPLLSNCVLRNPSRGVYIVSVSNDQGATFQRKVIVN